MVDWQLSHELTFWLINWLAKLFELLIGLFTDYLIDKLIG